MSRAEKVMYGLLFLACAQVGVVLGVGVRQTVRPAVALAVGPSLACTSNSDCCKCCVCKNGQCEHN